MTPSGSSDSERERLTNQGWAKVSDNPLASWSPTRGVSAEGVGFEPTVPFDTTVFETVRFVRSRIPPAIMLVGAQPLEELREQR